MSEQAIRELEAAAAVIMAPPCVVSNEQRQAAEGIFLDFRKSKNPYALCREILEKSENQYVMFESAEVLKEAVIREWSFLLESDKVSLRQYLMQYITTRSLPHFVRDRILQVIAIMVKRASINDSGQERATILQEVENLIMNAEPDKKILGCNIISNLMQEYASTVKSTDVGLPWEVHFKAKKQFEAGDLKRIFQFCIYLLSEVVKNDPPYEPSVVELTRHLLQISERILTWGYVSPILPKRLIGIYESVYESDQSPALKLSASWSEIILNPELLPLMFKIYWKVRNVDELAHHSLTCLVQLASLSGAVVSDDEPRLKYLHSYLGTFFNLISNITLKSKETLGVSNIVKKLVVFYVYDFSKLPDALQDTLLDEFTRLTCLFCDGAAEEDTQTDGDRYYTDAFDNMLEAWTTVLQEMGGTPQENIKNCATRIFNAYMQCHLAPPDGRRRESEDYEEEEDNDRIRYRDQLQTIGMFGRTVPEHSLPVLYRILESRIDQLLTRLHDMQSRAMTVSESSALNNLFEDLHWTLLIAGHVLCMDSDGEIPMIPSEMMHYSIAQTNSGAVDLQSTAEAIVAAVKRSGTPASIDRCDHVVRIVYNVMRLCAVEDHAVSLKLGHFMSPELGSTLVWFLKRWCLSYLLPVESFYQDISATLFGCFGKDADNSKLMVTFLLDKIQANLHNFQSEAVLLRDTMDLFCDIVGVKQKSTHIIKTDSMAKLIRLFERIPPGTLPPNVLRGLCKGFVLAGCVLSEPDDAGQYYDAVFRVVQSRFRALASRPDFAANCRREDAQNIVVDTLECLIGVAKGSRMSISRLLFDFLAPILDDLPALLALYHDYQVVVQLILELFGQCAKCVLCYLPPVESRRLYESALAAIQTYAKTNENRFTSDKLAEETNFQDLALVLDLLTFILSKDCLDLSAEGDGDANGTSVTASDVSLFGLGFVLPLMTTELLKFPSLCAQYYRLLVLINDIYPEKICRLPNELLGTMLRSIEIGLTNFGSDIVQACLDFVQGMACHVYRNRTSEEAFAVVLRPYLKLLLDLTLSHRINSDLYGVAATAIYALICCFPEDYRALASGLIAAQTDPVNAERLAAAFDNLTANVALTCDRQPKLRFRDNFEKFVANVHGFLLVK